MALNKSNVFPLQDLCTVFLVKAHNVALHCKANSIHGMFTSNTIRVKLGLKNHFLLEI
jgi:hypothetical protein